MIDLYVWLDVGLIYLISAIPIAALVTAWIQRFAPRWLAVSFAAMVLAASIWLAVGTIQKRSIFEIAPHAFQAVFARFIVALLLAFSLTEILSLVFRRRFVPAVDARDSRSAFIVGGLACAVLPTIYLEARSQFEKKRLAVLISQSRLGEASRVAQKLASIDPTEQFQTRTMSDVATELARTVQQLESQTAVPLDRSATDVQRLNRGRELAILGRNREAIATIQASPTLTNSPDACNLLGTIYETSTQWERSQHWYENAFQAWVHQPPSPQQIAGLQRSLTGIALCERRRGRYIEAELAYLELLSVAPTADTHFLLAQFYEDTQQATKARDHARIAMTMSPEKYETEAQKILNKLVTTHFGCMEVFVQRGVSR